MKINFKTNKALDKKLFLEFLNIKAAGVDFGANLIKAHPALKPIKGMNQKEKTKFISKYIDNYYAKNYIQIKNKLESTKNAWDKIEKNYFQEISKVFEIKRPIQKKYTAYISIMNACPRWIAKKEFCISINFPIKANLQTICHELTHFFFYEYITKQFPRTLTSEKKWDFSEIFNVVILNQEQFAKLYAPIIEQGYPEHKKYINHFNKAYNDSKDIKEFFKKGIVLAKKVKA